MMAFLQKTGRGCCNNIIPSQKEPAIRIVFKGSAVEYDQSFLFGENSYVPAYK